MTGGWACEGGVSEPGRVSVPAAPGSPSPSRDSLEPSPGGSLLNSSGTFAEGAVLVFGGWVLIPWLLQLRAPAGCL